MDKKIVLTAFLLLVGALLAGCAKQPAAEEKARDVSRIITASDGFALSYDYYKGSGNKPVLLLHMLGRSKEDWKEFALQLQSRGYDVLAIDFRGHGSSSGNLAMFSADDFNSMVLDVEAALNFFPDTEQISIVGASIGANIALKYAAKNQGILRVVLLSPGKEYRGVNIEQDAKGFKGKVLMAASKEDAYSYESVKSLQKALPQAEVIEEQGKGHGTNMLKDKDIAEKIIRFLR